MPGLAFPPMGPLGFGSPRSSVLCSAKTASCSFRVASLCRSLPGTLPSPHLCIPSQGSSTCGETRVDAGTIESAGSPRTGKLLQGGRRLSQVPELPLWVHAPLSDPGGVLSRSPYHVRELRPSAAYKASAFPSFGWEGYPYGPQRPDFGVQYHGLHLRYVRLRTPSYLNARGLCYGPARLKLWSGRICLSIELRTDWATSTSFKTSFQFIPSLRI